MYSNSSEGKTKTTTRPPASNISTAHGVTALNSSPSVHALASDDETKAAHADSDKGCHAPTPTGGGKSTAFPLPDDGGSEEGLKTSRAEQGPSARRRHASPATSGGRAGACVGLIPGERPPIRLPQACALHKGSRAHVGTRSLGKIERKCCWSSFEHPNGQPWARLVLVDYYLCFSSSVGACTWTY